MTFTKSKTLIIILSSIGVIIVVGIVIGVVVSVRKEPSREDVCKTEDCTFTQNKDDTTSSSAIITTVKEVSQSKFEKTNEVLASTTTGTNNQVTNYVSVSITYHVVTDREVTEGNGISSSSTSTNPVIPTQPVDIIEPVDDGNEVTGLGYCAKSTYHAVTLFVYYAVHPWKHQYHHYCSTWR